MPESLANKVAVVTGGTSGIGAAIVESLTAEGVACHSFRRRGPVVNPGATNTPIMLKRPVQPPPEMLAAMLLPEDVAEACLAILTMHRRAHIPELTILPTALQSIGHTNAVSQPPRQAPASR